MADGISDPVKKWAVIGLVLMALSMLTGRILAYYGVRFPNIIIYSILAEILFWAGVVGGVIIIIVLVILLRDRH